MFGLELHILALLCIFHPSMTCEEAYGTRCGWDLPSSSPFFTTLTLKDYLLGYKMEWDSPVFDLWTIFGPTKNSPKWLTRKAKPRPLQIWIQIV